jgi:hypothetical protein
MNFTSFGILHQASVHLDYGDESWVGDFLPPTGAPNAFPINGHSDLKGWRLTWL